MKTLTSVALCLCKKLFSFVKKGYKCKVKTCTKAAISLKRGKNVNNCNVVTNMQDSSAFP